MDCIKINRLNYSRMVSHYNNIVSKDTENFIIGENDLKQAIRNDIKEYENKNNRLVRSNGCVLMDWCVQVPTEIENDKKLTNKFYNDAVRFFKEKYKKDGFIVQGFVHQKEHNQKEGKLARPHIHIAVIPFGKFIDRKSKDKKIEKLGFSSDNHTTRKEYIFTHKDFYKYMTDCFGYELKSLKGKYQTKPSSKDKEIEKLNNKINSLENEIVFYEGAIHYFKQSVSNDKDLDYQIKVKRNFNKSVATVQNKLEKEYNLTLTKRVASFFTKMFGFVFHQKLTNKEKVKDNGTIKQ